jgi:membrane-associated phospholipid phosphatase
VNPDLRLLTEINDFARATPWLHAPMLILSTYALVVYAVLWVGTWWVARRQGSPRTLAAVVWAPIGLLAASVVSAPIGAAVGETRPCRTLPTIEVIGKCGKSSSFPSDHAVAAGAVIVGLLLVTRGLLAWIGVIAALLIAFSRLYLGVHYPHDTLAGLLLGAGVSLAGWFVLRGPLTRIAAARTSGRTSPTPVSG